MTADEIAEQCHDLFIRLVSNVPKEVYWEAAEELSSRLEGVIMEKQEGQE